MAHVRKSIRDRFEARLKANVGLVKRRVYASRGLSNYGRQVTFYHCLHRHRNVSVAQYKDRYA